MAKKVVEKNEVNAVETKKVNVKKVEVKKVEVKETRGPQPKIHYTKEELAEKIAMCEPGANYLTFENGKKVIKKVEQPKKVKTEKVEVKEIKETVKPVEVKESNTVLGTKEIKEYILNELQYQVKETTSYWGVRKTLECKRLAFGITPHKLGGCTLMLPVSFLKEVERSGYEFKRINDGLPIRVKITNMEQLKNIISGKFMLELFNLEA